MLTNTLRRLQVLLLGLLWIAPASAARAVEEPAPVDRAALLVRLPADAVLTIESKATRQTGPERRFVSPILPLGQKFVYTLRATWHQGGKEQKAERKATVQAGQVTRVDLTTTESAPKESQAKSRNFLFTYAATVTGLSSGKVARGLFAHRVAGASGTTMTALPMPIAPGFRDPPGTVKSPPTLPS